MERGIMNWLAAAVLGLAVLGSCAPTGSAGHDDSRLYGFAELEQHLTEHLRTVSDANHTATVAKAEALARLARAYMARTARPDGVVTPSSLAAGPAMCYSHHGKRAGACLDI